MTRGSWFVAFNVAALLSVSLWMRIWELDRLPGFAGDEAWFGLQGLRLLNGETVQWHTPIGRPANPFLIVLLAALHAIWSPGIPVLRWPAVICAIAAVAINYPLCRRVFGKSTAIITTVIMAVLPVNIVYSRIGWDLSHTLLATLPILYWPLLAVAEPDRRMRWLACAWRALRRRCACASF